MSHQSSASPTLQSRRHFIRISTLLGASVVLALIASSFAFIGHVRAATHPGGDIQNKVILNIDIARPAVVRIFTQYSATLKVQLCGSNVDTFTPKNPISLTGSGSFISANGDILTADHVVNTPKIDLDSFLISDYAQQISTDILAKCQQNISPTDVYNGYLNNPQLYTATYAPPQISAWLDTSYNGSYTESTVLNSKTYPISIKAESSFSKNDVAIVHVPLTDTPSINVGDSNAVSPTDKLTIIGYPGNGDLAGFLSQEKPTNFLTSAVNDIYVSAIKTNDNGGTLLQVGGNVEQGDSGGPALNANGEIVGIVSFGIGVSDPNQVGQTRFFQASSSVTPLISQANVNVTPGVFQTRWRQALTDYADTAANHWHKAADELSSLNQDYPNFRGISSYIDYAKQQAAVEKTTTTPTSPLQSVDSKMIIIGTSSLAGILLLLVVFLLIRGSRRSKTQKLAIAPVMANTQPTVMATTPPSTLTSYPYYGYGDAPATSAPLSPTPSSPWQYGQPQSATPPQAPPPPSTPYQYQPATGADATPYQQQQSQTAPTQRCVNGHLMQPHEVYCTVCGAGRSQS